jgi:hypothetical protein
MKKRMVSIVVCLLLCFSIFTVTGTSNSTSGCVKDKKILTAANHGIIWIGEQGSLPEPCKSETNWIHYDDGICDGSYGLVDGGYWVHEAIKLTPTELMGYSGAFVSLRVMHGEDFSSNYVAWIYKNVDHPSGNPLSQATIIKSGSSPAPHDWFYINFTTPMSFNQTDTVWIGVGWHQLYGYSSPIGLDWDGFAAGKSDWTWTTETGASWYEFSDCGLTLSWGLWVGIANDTTPPTTSINLAGAMQGDHYISPVNISFTATDDMSGVKSTMYQIDDGAWTTFSAPFVVSNEGTHTVSYYSIDNVGNVESIQTSTFCINYTIKITIKGGLGITVLLTNSGTTSLEDINWHISLDGSHIFAGKEKTGFIDKIASGESAQGKDFVFGFGPTTITVTACGQTVTTIGIIILFFVIGV